MSTRGSIRLFGVGKSLGDSSLVVYTGNSGKLSLQGYSLCVGVVSVWGEVGVLPSIFRGLACAVACVGRKKMVRMGGVNRQSELF